MGITASLGGDARISPAARPLRLLWLIDSLTMGGAETLALSFARSIDSDQIELTVCSRTTVDANPLEQEMPSTPTRVLNLDARNLFDWKAFRSLLRLIREQRIEIIHAHLTYASIWGALAGQISGIPVVSSLHVAPPKDAGWKEAFRQVLLRLTLSRLASRVVAVSAALREDLVRDGRLRPEKVAVVHNGIELCSGVPAAAEARLREGLDLPTGSPLIVTIAVLREGKGIDILIAAAADVLRVRPDARFVVVGDGPKSEEWIRLSESSAVAHAFRWTGFRRDVRAILREADLFVLPTLADAFPTVLLEAMDAGVPVIASDVGGIPEIVEADVTGILVPAGDFHSLAAAILSVLERPVWAKEAGRAAKARVEREFSVAAWVARLRSLYDEVLGGSGATP